MRVWLIKGLLHFFAKLSLQTVHRLATLLGWFINYLPASSLKRVVSLNIQWCFPHLPSSTQTTLIKQSLVEICKTFSELGILWLWSVPRVLALIKAISGEHYLQQAIQQGRGVILLTPHLGAWEMAGLYASAHYPLTALYRPPKLSGLAPLIHQARERAGGRFVPANQKGVKALFQALQRQQIVGILPDQVPTEAGIFAPFFGIPAYTMVLVSRLAQRKKVPVIFTYAKRLPGGGGFHLHFVPAPADISASDLTTAVSALNQGIEQCIEQCPSQYQWSYKRFKERSPDLIYTYE